MKSKLLHMLFAVLFAWSIGASPVLARATETDLAIDLAQAEAAKTVGGAQEDDALAPSIHDGNYTPLRRTQARSSLPAYYNSNELGYVTAARNQESFGTCWTFATIGAVESSMLTHGLRTSASELDLSERHLTYFSWHVAPDSLGNTAGDINTPCSYAFSPKCVGSDPYLSTGGSYPLAGHALESWMGVVEEQSVPTYENLVSTYANMGSVYDDAFSDAVALSQDLSHSRNVAHVSGIYRIAMNDVDEVKQAIVDNGAVGVSLRWNNQCLKRNDDGPTTFYNSARTDYGVRADYGHTVIIVGWDDNLSADCFRDSKVTGGAVPAGDGGWIAKNSWGDSWGTDGFFYISYHDIAFQSTNSKAYTYEVSPAEELENIYQYDGTSGTCLNYINSGGSIANIFHVKANPGGSEELRAVSISLADVNVDYSLQIYTDVADLSDPESGTPTLPTPVTGKTTFAGFYTVDLPTPVSLAEESDFAVMFTLAHDDDGEVGYEIDTTYGYGDRHGTSNSWAHYTSHVEPNQSFERDAADAIWDDLSSDSYDSKDDPSCCARVKAFTTNSDEVIEARPVWRRLSGNTALDTMQAILRADGVFNADTVDTVIIASSEDYRDALAATGLAGRLNAPVLITPKANLAKQTEGELQRLHPSKVYLAGGEFALSTNVMAQVRDALPYLSGDQVERIQGADGAHTAIRLYGEGDNWSDTAIVATSSSYKDALAIAPYAYAMGCPIFLANKEDKSIHADVISAIRQGGFKRVVITGGTLAVSGQVEKLLERIGIKAVRLGGQNALDTSGKIAVFELGEGMVLNHMAVATTGSYKDALCGAALAGSQNSVLVLVNQTGGFAAFDAAIESAGKTVRHGHVLGGVLAVSKDTEMYLRSQLV